MKPWAAWVTVLGATSTVMVWLVCPAAKLTVPDGSTPPAKSAALAGLPPLPATAHAADAATPVLPLRVTVKVNAVLPVVLSASVAAAVAMARVAGCTEGSGRMDPLALAVARVMSVDGLERVTVKPWAALVTVLGATSMVMVWLVCPAAKLTVPEGSTPPAKSAAIAGLLPLPATVQAAEAAIEVLPPRVTVKVNGVVPDVPSGSTALVGMMVRAAA